MKVIVAGGRDFTDYELLKKTLLVIFSKRNLNEIEIVSGKARGADTLGEKFAEEFGLRVHEFPADWSIGKQAGYLRNKEMAEFADAAVVFMRKEGSKGSQHMINLAKEKGLPVRIISW